MLNKLQKAHDKLHLISTRFNERQVNIMPVEEPSEKISFSQTPDGKISVQIRNFKKKSAHSTRINFGNLPLFKDVLFEFQDDLSKSAYLVGDFCRWLPQAILMQKNKVNNFKTAVSLEDGEILYRFEVDGEIRLDPKYVNEIFIGKNGICSRINLTRYVKKIEIKNKSNKKFCGVINLSEDWIEVDKSQLTILPDDKEEITVTILPDKMVLGENISVVKIISIDNPKKKCVIEIHAKMMVNGMVPKIKRKEFNLAPFQRGDEVKVNLSIEVIGKGILNGRISSPNGVISENIRVENLTPSETTIEKDIIIDTKKISNTLCDGFSAIVVTDSYIWNRRCFPLTFTFESQMIHLKTSLPGLNFPKVFWGEKTKMSILKVTRSDYEKVDISILIPEDLSTYLTGCKLREDEWELKFDPARVSREKIGYISGVIKIKDEISNLEEQIPLIAEVSDKGERQ
ncbi:MAG: hypothetical protein AB1414_07815 [bacterium]